MTERKFKTVEVAARIGVTERTLQRWRENKTGPVWGRSGARIHYNESDVIAWEREQKEAKRNHYSTAEAARLLDLSERTLLMWRADGVGPEFNRNGREIRYPKAAFDAWAKEKGFK